MFILFYHSMNAEQSFENLPFSGVNQEKPHDKKFKITILCGKGHLCPFHISSSFESWKMSTHSIFPLHHYAETDTYHCSLLPGKFADIQQVSLTKVKQLVNKLGGQFVPSRVHDQPCCTEQPFASRGSGRRCEVPAGPLARKLASFCSHHL